MLYVASRLFWLALSAGEIMGNVIKFDGKLQLSEEKKAARTRRRKIMAVRKAFQCSHCAMKCEKCGTRVHPEGKHKAANRNKSRVPYRFCESCAEDYVDYIETLKGRKDPDCYWQNNPWLDSWGKWIDWQGAVNRYIKSKEFVRLLHELRRPELD
jgi:hypothetical protein